MVHLWQLQNHFSSVFHQKNATLHKTPSLWNQLTTSTVPWSTTHGPHWKEMMITRKWWEKKHLGKNQLKFNQGLQDQDLCREKQASNKDANNFITDFFFALIFNASGRKRILFLPRSLLVLALKIFQDSSPSRSMLSDWCHWKHSLWIYHIPISHSRVWRCHKWCYPTGMNLCQAWGLFLLVEEAWWGLIAWFRHDLNLLVFEGSFPHLVIHKLILLEHAQLHLCLDTHYLRDTTGYKTCDTGDLKASE